MGISKYRYYFSKPRSEIAKDIFSWIAAAGIIAFAATSPYFIRNLLQANERLKKYPKKKIQDTVSAFRKRGLLHVTYSHHQVYISLTKEGRKKAGLFQIDNLKISRPLKWDKKWRILVFDIAQMKKFHREALRGKLKSLGFFLFQKSVWVHAFDCSAEVELLRDFFGLSSKEMCLIVAEKVENDEEPREFFGL